LFCADKHREGSDIPFLDGCMFLDNVRERSIVVFIQCIGRIMRTCVGKTFGLVIDSYIKDTETENMAVFSKITQYYNIISNSDTYFNSSKEKINRYNVIKESINLDVKREIISFTCHGITIEIKCSDITWNNTKAIKRDINETICNSIGITESERHMINNPNYVDIKQYNFRKSTILSCRVNNIILDNLRYMTICRYLYDIINNSNKIINNTTLKIITDKKNQNGWRYIEKYNISFQSVNANKTMLEIYTQCIKNNIKLSIQIRLSNSNIISIAT
jgi:hypothetical protein